MENNFAWLNHICDNTLKHEDWYDDKVIYFNYHKAVMSASPDIEYINARDIVGITHDGYIDKDTPPTWSELLEKLSRFSRFRETSSNRCKDDLIRVIYSEDVFPPDYKRVYEWNGSYYISTGHHRLTVAKFLSVTQIRVLVNHVAEMNKE